MGSQCKVQFKVKKPYSADIKVSRLHIVRGKEEIVNEDSLTLNSDEEGTIKIHFQLFKLEQLEILKAYV